MNWHRDEAVRLKPYQTTTPSGALSRPATFPRMVHWIALNQARLALSPESAFENSEMGVRSNPTGGFALTLVVLGLNNAGN